MQVGLTVRVRGQTESRACWEIRSRSGSRTVNERFLEPPSILVAVSHDRSANLGCAACDLALLTLSPPLFACTSLNFGSLLVLVDNSDTEFEFSLLISTEFGIQTHTATHQ
jgi:hypothetical protein